MRVANKTYNIGNLQFARPTQNATIIKVIIIFGILFLFAIIAGCVLYYMKRNNKGYWKVKRAHGEHNVHYTAGAHVQVGPPHERFYQMNSPNEDQRMASENCEFIFYSFFKDIFNLSVINIAAYFEKLRFSLSDKR